MLKLIWFLTCNVHGGISSLTREKKNYLQGNIPRVVKHKRDKAEQARKVYQQNRRNLMARNVYRQESSSV